MEIFLLIMVLGIFFIPITFCGSLCTKKTKETFFDMRQFIDQITGNLLSNVLEFLSNSDYELFFKNYNLFFYHKKSCYNHHKVRFYGTTVQEFFSFTGKNPNAYNSNLNYFFHSRIKQIAFFSLNLITPHFYTKAILDYNGYFYFESNVKLNDHGHHSKNWNINIASFFIGECYKFNSNTQECDLFLIDNAEQVTLLSLLIQKEMGLSHYLLSIHSENNDLYFHNLSPSLFMIKNSIDFENGKLYFHQFDVNNKTTVTNSCNSLALVTSLQVHSSHQSSYQMDEVFFFQINHQSNMTVEQFFERHVKQCPKKEPSGKSRSFD